MNKKKVTLRTRLIAVAVMLFSTLFTVIGVKPLSVHAIDEEVVAKVWPAVVRINGVVQIKQNGKLNWVPIYVCSGSILTPDGFILTNDHCTRAKEALQEIAPQLAGAPTKLMVSLTKQDDEPPVPSFFATIMADSPRQGGLDIAVLKVAEDLTGKPVNSANLHLPTVKVGDSDKVKLGQRVHLFGYQTIGGDTITFTSGDVSGFTYQAGVNGRAWIKHTATAAGGDSGGTAVNDQGELIGIPTEMGSGDANGDIADCRRLVDTNGDGKIDDKDSCIPGGGFINAIRPVNIAKPFIEQAESGGGIAPPDENGDNGDNGDNSNNGNDNNNNNNNGTPTPSATPSAGKASVLRTFFSADSDEDDQPVGVVTSLPSHSHNMLFFFDYAGFEKGATVQPRLFVNGKELTDAWPASPWSGSAVGETWVGIKDPSEEVPDGTYKFQIDYQGKALGSAEIKVGGAATNGPTFTDLAFMGDSTNDSKPGHVIQGDTKELNASFSYKNVTKGGAWNAEWYELDQAAGKWNSIGKMNATFSATSGTGKATLTDDKPFETAAYRVDVLVNNQVRATGMVIVLAGGGTDNGNNNNNNGDNGGTGFGPITFASKLDNKGKPVDANTKFDSGIDKLFGVFDYQGMENGLPWNITWDLDGQPAVSRDLDWDNGPSGTTNASVSAAQGSSLPDGEYTLHLSVQGQELQTGKATIGNGSADNGNNNNNGNNGNDNNQGGGVTVTGTVVDAVTGKPIEGATFVVLKEGVKLADFTGDNSDVLDLAVTDQSGSFLLNTELKPNVGYSVGLIADGYQTLGDDNVVFSDHAPDRVNLTLKMQKH